MIRRALYCVGRLSFASAALLTAVYAFLASLPFVYEQFLRSELFASVRVFRDLQPLWYGLGVALLFPSIAGYLRPGRPARRWTLGFLAFQAALVGVLAILQPVAGLRPGNRSLLVATAAAAMPVWLAAIDVVASRGRIHWKRPDVTVASALFGALTAAALLTTGGHALLAIAPGGRADSSLIAGAVASAGALLTCSLAVFLALYWLASISAAVAWGTALEFFVLHAAAAGLIGHLLCKAILPAVGATGWPAALFAYATGAAVSCINGGLCLSVAQRNPGPVESGLKFSLSWYAPGAKPGVWRVWLLLMVLPVLAAMAEESIAHLDWNHLGKKLIAFLSWLLAFALVLPVVHPLRQPWARWVCVSVAVVAVFLFRGASVAAAAWSPVLDRYVARDAAFRLARDLTSQLPSDTSFRRFLTQNTNLPRSLAVTPPVIELSPGSSSTPARYPLLLITVDSLRRDYLSAYNAKVRFTPEIGRFGRESIVFRNSFTHYGGTGLSEPSIWSGSLLLHQQYVLPFAPMNSLEKLIDASGYRKALSLDTILAVLLRRDPALTDLEKGEHVMDYDLCRSLETLLPHLSPDPAAPALFSYTQPQNLHISVIQRQGAKSLDAGDYGEFYAPYASRLRRIDGCFGKFLESLRAKGLYDRSIIILTSDHGDDLGEDGRWGHAYSLTPEILQIPLIIHLPEELRRTVRWNPDQTVFSSDITPSLYFLLGRRPVRIHPLFGRSLFFTSEEEAQALRRDYHLVASSYAPVYGILDDDARRLFVSDALNHTDTIYDLAANGAARSRKPDDRTRRQGQQRIREGIGEINRFFGVTPPGESGPGTEAIR